MAVLLPFIGFVLGVVMAARGDRHGGGILVVSIGAFIIWYAVVTAEQGTTYVY